MPTDTTVPPGLSRPTDLSEKGNLAYDAIMKVLRDRDALYTGGCTGFYSPMAWKERGETYGTESFLVVVYDGGDLTSFFRGGECDKDYMKMVRALEEIGLYFEECTHWYAAIYE